MSYINFTIVGTPTITDDGIASGFPSSNYLTINTSNIDWTRPYKIKIKCNTGSIRTNRKANANLTCKDMPIIRLSNYKFHFSPSTTFSSIGSVGEIIDNTTIDDSTTYYLIVNYDGTTYTFSKSIDDISYTTIGTSTTIQTNLTTGGTSTIGCGYGIDNNTNRVWDGSIDLKQFKIYVDGNLVYQPYSSDFKLINRIYNRHDTASNFSTNNPVLGDGEVAVETDTSKIKVGDGSTAYNALPYVGGSGDLTNYYTKSETDSLLDNKQDSFDAVEPITLNNIYSKIAGLTISGNAPNRHMYATNYASEAGLNGQASDGELYMAPTAASSVLPASGDYTSMDAIFLNGYYLNDYSLGDTIYVTPAVASAFVRMCAIGYMQNGLFIPVIIPCFGHNTSTYVNTGTPFIYNSGSRAYLKSNSVTSISYSTSVIDASTTYQAFRITEDTTNYYIADQGFYDGSSSSARACTATIAKSSTAGQAIAKCDTIALIPKDIYRLGNCGMYANGVLFRQEEIRLVKSTANLNRTTLDAEANKLLFETNAEGNKLELSVGAGLAVQSSSLVNSLALDGITRLLPITQTDYDNLATKDASTFYIIIPAGNS